MFSPFLFNWLVNLSIITFLLINNHLFAHVYMVSYIPIKQQFANSCMVSKVIYCHWIGIYLYIYVYISVCACVCVCVCVKISGTVDKLKHSQRIQKWYFVFIPERLHQNLKSPRNIIIESVVCVSVHPFFHLYFHILSDLPNLPFLSIYIHIYTHTLLIIIYVWLITISYMFIILKLLYYAHPLCKAHKSLLSFFVLAQSFLGLIHFRLYASKSFYYCCTRLVPVIN